jgi:hypothetical protein
MSQSDIDLESNFNFPNGAYKGDYLAFQSGEAFGDIEADPRAGMYQNIQSDYFMRDSIITVKNDNKIIGAIMQEDRGGEEQGKAMRVSFAMSDIEQILEPLKLRPRVITPFGDDMT